MIDGFDGAHVVDVDTQLLAHRGQRAREEDVAGRRDAEERLAARVGGEVDDDAALAPVRDLEERVGAVDLEVEEVLEPALRVPGRRLDLDHLGPEVGHDRAGRGDERPVRELDHLDSRERSGHRVIPPGRSEAPV